VIPVDEGGLVDVHAAQTILVVPKCDDWIAVLSDYHKVSKATHSVT
jgi:hypothetical protein